MAENYAPNKVIKYYQLNWERKLNAAPEFLCFLGNLPPKCTNARHENSLKLAGGINGEQVSLTMAGMP